MDRIFLGKLRAVSLVEGISTLVLFFVAMPLKYLGGMPKAVTIAGSVHGGLFTALLLMFLIGWRRIPLSNATTLTGIVAAIFPFGPFLFDRRLKALEAEAGS
ncbi:MAG: DUF3817 domain-containing protein [Planctomycetota bacterium]